MSVDKYKNQQYSGGGTDVPLCTGDRRYAQDRARDFWFLVDRVGKVLDDMMGQLPILLSGGVVTQGAGLSLDITAGYGYAEFNVDIPLSFASVPPTKTNADLESIKIVWGSQNDINASSANCSVYTVIDDGATVQYVKMLYLETDGTTRARAKSTGTYSYEVVPDFDLIVDAVAPGDDEILLATFTNSGGTYTITASTTHILTYPTISEISNLIDGGIDWTSAQQVGNDLNISTIGTPVITALSGADVAFIDATQEDLRTYRFDGTDWAQVGNDLNIAGITSPSLAALNGTDVAYIDDTNDDLRLYRFDGTDWAQVGNDLNITGVSSPSLTALNGTDVAFIDDTQEDLRTYRFDGTDWAQVGNDLNISGILAPSITALNGTDVAFIDSTNDDLRTYRFDGTDWAQVGNDLNISTIGTPVITALNGTDVAYIDSTKENLKTYRFDGTDWAQVGNYLNIPTISTPALAALNGTDVAFIDATQEDLRLYRFDFVPKV